MVLCTWYLGSIPKNGNYMSDTRKCVDTPYLYLVMLKSLKSLKSCMLMNWVITHTPCVSLRWGIVTRKTGVVVDDWGFQHSSLTSGDGRGAGRLMPMAMIWLISACVIPKEAGNLQYVWRSPEGMKAEPHIWSVEMVWYPALGSLNVSLNSVICTSKLIEPREGGAGTSCLLL